MNVIYLILIALGFSAGILATTLKTDSRQATNTATEKIIESEHDSSILVEPEPQTFSIYLFTE